MRTLVGNYVALHSDPTRGKLDMICLNRHIKDSLQVNHKNCTDNSSCAIKSLLMLNPPIIQKVWDWMKVSYKNARNRSPSLTRVTIERILMKQVDLYRRVPSPGEKSWW